MYTFHFLKSNWKFILNVTCGISIKRQFCMIVKTIFFCRNTKALVPVEPFLFPVFVPFFLCAGTYKELHFHLLKFAHAKNKLPGHNFIPECFTNLCNTKRDLH